MKPNLLLDNLKTIPNIQNELFEYLNNIISESDNKIINTNKHQAILLESDTNRFLVFNNSMNISVYCEGKQFKTNTFNYDKIAKDDIYAQTIFKIPNPDIDKILSQEDLSPAMLQIRKKQLKYANPFSSTDSLYGLEDFFRVAGTPSSLKNKNLEFLLNIKDENQFDPSVVQFHLERLYQSCLDNKFTIKNKYEFNDLDNHLWIQNKKLCFSCQNFQFVADKLDNGWAVYTTPLYYDILKNRIKPTELINSINDGTVDNLSNGVLIIKDNKVVFNDFYVSGIMFSQMIYNIDSLESEKLLTQSLAPGNKILTPDEYIINSIAKYPTLYLKYSYEQSKIAVLDHIFNTIGSGSSEFLKTIEEKPVSYENIEPWFGDVKVYSDDSTGKTMVLFKESEDGFPIEKKKDYFHIPYPNFQKKYSLIHSNNYINMDDSWKQAALDFYRYCKDFFNDENKYKHYHHSFSSKNLKNQNDESPEDVFPYNSNLQLLNEMQKVFKDKTKEEISKNFEFEFLGDPKNRDDIIEFLERRWDKEREKINSFIDETISMIETDLNKNKNKKPKP